MKTRIPRVTRETLQELEAAGVEGIDLAAFRREQPELYAYAEQEGAREIEVEIDDELRELAAGDLARGLRAARAVGAMHLCWLAIARQMEKGQ